MAKKKQSKDETLNELVYEQVKREVGSLRADLFDEIDNRLGSFSAVEELRADLQRALRNLADEL
jgi:hypothetical protein